MGERRKEKGERRREKGDWGMEIGVGFSGLSGVEVHVK